jgi:hypothetical protein
MLMVLLLHVSLAVPPTPALAPETLHAAVIEAAALWSPYGVAVDAAAPCGWAADDRTVLTVRTVETRQSAVTAAWRGPLGAIVFAPGGRPDAEIRLFLGDILQLVARTRVLGALEPQWPSSLRHVVVGRVVGRVLAHEIGHFVLASPRHGAGGLMRPLQFPEDLVGPSRHGFTLSRSEIARLEALR